MTAKNTRTYTIGTTTFQAPPLDSGLYLVATPIGNLKDITIRALETLCGADIIACEDTRVTRILLQSYAILQKPQAYHEHNATQVGASLLSALSDGKSVALVSDAGTPLISDPGFDLVRQAQLAGIPIHPLPGACALLAGLVASGLPTTSFLFDGFLPAKQMARCKRLEQLRPLDNTLIFYESPHRIGKTLTDMADILGASRSASLCRELTKYFETIDTDTIGELAKKYTAQQRVRGEIVLVVSGASCDATPPPLTQESLDNMLRQAIKNMSPARAAKEIAVRTGKKKEQLYQRLLTLKQINSQ